MYPVNLLIYSVLMHSVNSLLLSDNYLLSDKLTSGTQERICFISGKTVDSVMKTISYIIDTMHDKDGHEKTEYKVGNHANYCWKSQPWNRISLAAKLKLSISFSISILFGILCCT